MKYGLTHTEKWYDHSVGDSNGKWACQVAMGFWCPDRENNTNQETRADPDT